MVKKQDELRGSSWIDHPLTIVLVHVLIEILVIIEKRSRTICALSRNGTVDEQTVHIQDSSPDKCDIR